MAGFVHHGIENHVATVRLDRTEVHNAFNEEVIARLTAAFEALGADDAVRVIVLGAAGKNFCAGADIKWMKKVIDYSFEENVEDAMTLAGMLRTIRECPKPVVARVHGAVFGGGVGLVAACDMAVACAAAVFCLSEVRLGIVPAVISPYVLEKMGAAARRYALTAERFDAAEAKRVGLVSEVVEREDQLDDWIAGIVRSLLRNGPEALACCKQVLRDVPLSGFETAEVMTTRLTAERRVSAEGQDGLGAFLQKRSPGWVVAD